MVNQLNNTNQESVMESVMIPAPTVLRGLNDLILDNTKPSDGRKQDRLDRPGTPNDFALEILCVTASSESLSPTVRLHRYGTTPDCRGAEDSIRGTGPETRRRLASESAQLIGTFVRFSV